MLCGDAKDGADGAFSRPLLFSRLKMAVTLAKIDPPTTHRAL